MAWLQLVHKVGLFQSTPLHEGRHMQPSKLAGRLQFQSTPLHEGRPRARAHLQRGPGVSIHAPT